MAVKQLRARRDRQDLASESLHRLYRDYSNYSLLNLACSCVSGNACVPGDDWAQETFCRIRSCVAFSAEAGRAAFRDAWTRSVAASKPSRLS